MELVSGIPSFCAAAARLGMPLTEWDEPLHIVPAVHQTDFDADQPGTTVFMKSGSKMKDIKTKLQQRGGDACAVVNCGMKNELVFRHLGEIPDDAGYFSLIISKERTPCCEK